MKKHYYRYFISYYYYYWQPKSTFINMNSKPYQPDFACITIDLDTIIDSDEDIRLIMEVIKKDLMKSKKVVGDNIIILSFQLMKEYDKESED